MTIFIFMQKNPENKMEMYMYPIVEQPDTNKQTALT